MMNTNLYQVSPLKVAGVIACLDHLQVKRYPGDSNQLMPEM